MAEFEFGPIVEGTERGQYRRVHRPDGELLWVRQLGEPAFDTPSLADGVILNACVELLSSHLRVPGGSIWDIHDESDDEWPRCWTIRRPGLRSLFSRLSVAELSVNRWDLCNLRHDGVSPREVARHIRLRRNCRADIVAQVDDALLWTFYQPDGSRVLISDCCRDGALRRVLMYGVDRRWVRAGWHRDYLRLIDGHDQGRHVWRVTSCSHPVRESIWEIHSVRDE